MLRYVSAVRRNLRKKLRRARLKRAHAQHRAQHPEFYRGNDEILERYRAGGGLNHIYQDYKLASLRALLQERRPKLILELGSGSTTAVFADYVRHAPDSRLVCVDESEVYLGKALAIAGIEDGDPRFEKLIRDQMLVRDDDGKVVARRYSGDFPGNYDLVFIDGPSGSDEQGVRHKAAYSADILDIVRRHPPKTIVVDGKFATVAAIREHFGDLYRVFPSEVKSDKPRSGYRYFSYFHLKDGEPQA